MPTVEPAPLLCKPDFPEAAARWEAYLAGDLIDRPVVCVTAPRPGAAVPAPWQHYGYRERVFDDIDGLLDRVLAHAEATFYGGEAIPAFMPSIAADEIAVFTSAELRWSPDSPDTNWAVPYVENWEAALPLRLHEESPMWQRMLALVRRAAERLAGRMLIQPLDWHTNMDLLSAIRGPQRLCLDVVERPELIDRAMASARSLFPVLWDAIRTAGSMDERGYTQGLYSPAGTSTLACDFAALIGPRMFRRWVLPALEEEAALVGHAYFHWDGPDALKHMPDLLASPYFHTIGYVPGKIAVDGSGDRHPRYIEMYKTLQAAGKSVHVWGTPDELMYMHRRLRPEKTLYTTSVASQTEAEALLDWFARHT